MKGIKDMNKYINSKVVLWYACFLFSLQYFFYRVHFNSSAKEEARKIKNMAKKVPCSKRSKYKESYMTNQYKTGPELITPMKLWAILYLALRIHNNAMQLGDMLR